MSIDTDRAQVELSMKNARKNLDLAKSLERLRSNRDFKAVILEGYFKEEAVRLVHLRSAPDTQAPHNQASILLAIDSIANLYSHFLSVENAGRQALKELADGDEALEQLAQDEADEQRGGTQ